MDDLDIYEWIDKVFEENYIPMSDCFDAHVPSDILNKLPMLDVFSTTADTIVRLSGIDNQH